MSTLSNINFKQGNTTESRQESQAEIKVLTEGISVKTTLAIYVSTNKSWNNIRNCYCNHPANITRFPKLTLLWSASWMRRFSNTDVWLHTSVHLQAVLATYSLNESMPSSFLCPASWRKAPDVNTKWGAHLFYATSKLKYITCLYIN